MGLHQMGYLIHQMQQIFLQLGKMDFDLKMFRKGFLLLDSDITHGGQKIV